MDNLHSNLDTNVGEVVYVLGAGVNRDIKDSNGFSPPLLDDFFKVALSNKTFSDENYDIILKDVYEYIELHWSKTKSDLAEDPFNIEELFTGLDDQLFSALDANDLEKAKILYLIQLRLQSFFAEVLQGFGKCVHKSENLILLARLIYDEMSSIITFNYDCFIESLIEFVSGFNLSTNRPFETFNMYNWSKLLGYGTTNFDIVELPQSGIGNRLLNGENFYSNFDLYSLSVLKLHGSLNWFKYLPLRKIPELDEDGIKLPNDKLNKLLFVPSATWRYSEPPNLDGWYLDPVIITPTSYKEKYLEMNNSIFNPIWENAKKTLINCKKLVIIGYSFSDDLPKKLFSEAFSKHTLEELIRRSALLKWNL